MLMDYIVSSTAKEANHIEETLLSNTCHSNRFVASGKL